MEHILRIFLIFFLVASIPTYSTAQQVAVAPQQTVLRVATIEASDISSIRFMEVLATEAAKNDIKIETLSGFFPSEVFSLLNLGNDSIDFAILPARNVQSIQSDGSLIYTSLITQPGLVASADEAGAIQDSFVGDMIAGEMAKTGLTVVSFLNLQPNAILVQRKLSGASDLQGVKVVSGSPASAQLFTQLGATPVQMSFAEIYPALQTGFADAAEANASLLLKDDFLELSRDGTVVDNFRQNPGFLLANRDRWLRFPQRIRSILQDASGLAREASQTELVSGNQNLANLAKEFGVTYTSVGLDGWQEIQLVAADVWLSGVADGSRDQAYADLKTVKEEYQERIGRGGSLTPLDSIPKILFATNRNDEGGAVLAHRFGIVKSPQNLLSCGEIKFDPAVRRSFGKPYRGEISIDGTLRRGPSDCAKLIREAAGPLGKATIFFHGYNNSLGDAVNRAIGFARDFRLNEPVIVWSWPSAGTYGEYIFDLNSVEFTSSYIRNFVTALSDAGMINNISIICHSMGSRIGGQLLRKTYEIGKKLPNLVFVAADYPQSSFEQMMDEVGAAAIIKTLYANQHDRALGFSRAQSSEVPIGLGGSYLKLVQSLETVDVSDVARWGIDNHAHGFDVRPVVNDLSRLLVDRLDASGRSLPESVLNGQKYWVIQADD